MKKQDVEKIVVYALQFFMIPETWQVSVDFSKTEGASKTTIFPDYFRAEVVFGPDVLKMPKEQAYEVIGHEVGHVMIGMHWYAFGTSLREMLKKQKASWFFTGWTTSEENMATMLGRMFARGMIDAEGGGKEQQDE